MNDQTNDPSHDPGPDHLGDAEAEALLERLAHTFPHRAVPLPVLLSAARQGRRARNRRVLAAGVVALAVVAGGGTAALYATGNNDTRRSDTKVATDPSPTPACTPGGTKSAGATPPPQGPDYPTNANGLTYGGRGQEGDPHPDLLAAVGDCGVQGYVYPSDLEEKAPWEPGAGNGEPRTVRVFESDGVTEVDTFTQSEGTTTTEAEPGEAPQGVEGAELQGEWVAIIAGKTGAGGSQQYDTYRDLDLRVTFDGDRVQVWDGCQTWEAVFSLTDGEFFLTTSFVALDSPAAECDRAAPLPAVVENIRHVTPHRADVHLHLGNWQIVVVLTSVPQ